MKFDPLNPEEAKHDAAFLEGVEGDWFIEKMIRSENMPRLIGLARVGSMLKYKQIVIMEDIERTERQR